MTDVQAIPTDDAALDLLEHALNATLEHRAGEPILIGAEYSLHQLLDFWAGVDPDRDCVLVSEDDEPPAYELTKAPFGERDLIRALIVEIRRLRGTYDYWSL